jgi:hypothetical protein
MAVIAFSPLAATLSQAPRALTSDTALDTVPLQIIVRSAAGTIAKSDSMTMSRVRYRS